MTDDIVNRLRMWGGDPATWHSDPIRRIADGVPQEMLHEAADEIERLWVGLRLAVEELMQRFPHKYHSTFDSLYAQFVFGKSSAQAYEEAEAEVDRLEAEADDGT